jgi:GNAT superfamily N-acetyltransferase
LRARYPDRSAVPAAVNSAFTRLDIDEVERGRGAFLIASIDDVDIACGAVRDIGGKVGELKRMFVAPEYRGRGVASALIRALEGEASQLGIDEIVLEVATGKLAGREFGSGLVMGDAAR